MELKIRSFNELTGVEVYEILKSRAEVFVVEQDCVYQDIDDKDKKSYHLFFEDNNRVVAYVRAIPCGVSYKEASIGRVITLKEYRGTGISKKLMIEAINFIENHYGETKIRISAQKYIIKFYENVGFKQVTESYLEDDIPHVGMLYEKK
ncbi:GNAT family N-acetyltransferase [uncultured Clostridium sp.]|jgi:ElaA protein|uniref:GNAT family N-acetyltransferase n=1 Tax=uncultured Clostridium sp. TaxID=59620 RepID=UPI002615CC0D|nr:GNAT family N-acetyltransferase [uncultured Clostridium sp.]